MKQNLLKTCVPLGTLLLLSGCIDNKYDLSDIDKTTQINVNDLVVPVNVDAITLDDIIELDDDSKIKIVKVNGQDVYAVTEHGTIDSNDIDIAGFTATKPTINPATATFEIKKDLPTRAFTETYDYKLKESDPQDVSITADNVDKSVKEITALGFEPMTITMNMTASGLAANSTLELPWVEFNFLKGLVIPDLPQGYHYDAKDGKLRVDNLPYNGKSTITVTATGLDFSLAEATLENQKFTFDSEVKLFDGEMKLHVTYSDTETPAEQGDVTFTLITDVNELKATSFSGKIEYTLEGDGLNIDPVDLSDLPDFLSDEKTDLLLANPQIYINLNNPVANYKLGFSTGLELTSIRPDGDKTYVPEENVMVGYNHGVAGPYNFVISPKLPDSPLADYKENLDHVEFSKLSEVLQGDGLPEKLEINLVNPELYEQSVEDFPLPNLIKPGVTGKWEFLAPLALKDGSVIIYSTTEDGWADDELDKMTINSLTLTADAASTLPLGAELTVHPIDRNGNLIPGLKIEKANLKAFAKNEPISVSVSGEIRELDGVRIEAVVHPASEEALAPAQAITLNNVKVKVSGYYLTDFE